MSEQTKLSSQSKPSSTTTTVESTDPRELMLTAIANRDRQQLHDLIELYFGVNIPDKKICDDHCAPFDFIFDYLVGDIDFAVVLGNRSGGKTHGFGILDTLVSYLYDGVEIATVGAIKFQAQKCYEYYRNYSNRAPFSDNLTDQASMSRTVHKNKSEVQVLTGTMSGVNAPHPQLLFTDEIDLMPWNVLQQALSMPQSKNGVKSKTVLTSTRKFASGAMQKLLDDAPKKGYKVYQWCIWEVIEPMPKDKAEQDRIAKIFGSELPHNIHLADGYYTWRDAILKKLSPMEDETWAVEWLCRKPGTEGTVYGSAYNDDINLIGDWSPLNEDGTHKPGHLYLLEDYGASKDHPDVVLFVWIPLTFDRMVIFDELYLVDYGTDEIWEAIADKMLEYGYDMPDLVKSIRGDIEGWIPDYHGLTETMDRANRGAPMMDKLQEAALYLVENGIKMVRGLLLSGRIMLTNKCYNTRSELMGDYRYAKNADGSYSRTPIKKNDHCSDALRFGVIMLHHRLVEAIMRATQVKYYGDHPEAEPKKPQDVEPAKPALSPYQSPTAVPNSDLPLTGDLMHMRW